MRRLLPILGLAVALALALGLFVLRGGDESPGPAGTGAPPAGAPVSVDRRPVGEAHAAPLVPAREDGAGAWVELNNRATALLAEGALEEAVELLEESCTGDPGNDVFRRNLAEALARLARREYEERELAAAVEHLARVLQLAPDREDAHLVAETLARWREEARVEENHWTGDTSDLFALSYDADRGDILHNSQEVLDHLERAYDDMRLWFGADPVRGLGRAPIRVALYDPDEFDRVTGLGDWAGGVFDGVVRISVEDLSVGAERWASVLTHELVHVFVHELGGGAVPGWLNEGLAQVLEPSPRIDAARKRLASGEIFSLDRLQGSLASWEDAGEIRRAYAQSLLVCHAIRTHYGDEALLRMLLGCAEGRPPEESFEEWTSVPLSFVLEELL